MTIGQNEIIAQRALNQFDQSLKIVVTVQEGELALEPEIEFSGHPRGREWIIFLMMIWT